ncbi:OmpA family protein [Ferruginibacter sp.]|nr:OmpA family protein [Ferruginibacter sp.]
MLQYIFSSSILKKTFSVIPALLLLQGLLAQTRYGVIAGAGKSSLYKFAFSPEDYNRYSSTTSLWGGITADLTLVPNNIHLFISAVYSQKGYKYTMQKQTGANNTLKDSGFKQALKYADLNINLRKTFVFGEEENNSFFAGTGPVISLLSGGKEEIQTTYFGNSLPATNTTNSKLTKGTGAGKYKPVFFSWSIGAGFEINQLSIFINANIPLTDYYQDAQKAVKHKVKTFGINIGYTLFTHQKREKAERTKPDRDAPVVVIDTLADTDGDGITDIHDKCPGHKGTEKYFGCPVPDTDGDGVNDDDDKCISVAGPVTNKGCPIVYADTVKPAQKDTFCYTIYFEPGKSILRSEAYKTLEQVVQKLKANPKLVAVFTGHTDNVGSVVANYNRSIGRATVCADQVASYYIDKKRLTILSLGNTKPAADLNDPLVQWKNRRVEVCVFEQKQ